jgi:hypothetical protein
MGLADDIFKFDAKAKKAISDDIINKCIAFFSVAVDYSPLQDSALYPGAYATGLFANSWYVAVNEFDSTVGTIPDEKASMSRGRIELLRHSKAFFGKDEFISLTNNIPYADRVEYLGWPEEDGYSGFIGPYAPLRNAVVKVKGIFKQ